MSVLKLLAAKIPVGAGNGQINIPKTSDTGLLNGILGTVYWAAGITAVVVIIVAAILFVTADGDPGKIKRARQTILYAIVGLVIVMMAFVITNFIVGRF